MKINVVDKNKVKFISDDAAAVGSVNHFNRLFAIKYKKTPVRLHACYIRPNGVAVLELETLGGTLVSGITQAAFNVKISNGEIMIKERDI